MRILELDRVFAAYGPYRALNGLTLSIDEGEAVAVIGRNGVGKSTLARVASGLVAISSGTIEIVGERGPRFDVHRLARRGVVHLPEGVGLFSGLTIEENLTLRLAGVSRSLAKERLARALDSLGELGRRRRTRAGQLSGGQQRLVAVAGALAAEPKLLLADEPALGLSPAATDEVYGALASARSKQTTLVIVETRLGRVEALCPRSIVMDRGVAVYDGAIKGAPDVMANLLNPDEPED